MEKEVIIHVGMPKTGTTALQYFCFQNREFLLQDLKILYPKAGLVDSGHHGIILYPETLHILEEELKVENDKYSKVLLTSEYLMINPLPTALIQLIDRIKKIGDYKISVIKYIRRQDRLIESAYGQDIKSPYIMAKLSIKDNFRIWSKTLNYYENLTKFLNSVGGSVNLKLLLYEQLIDHNTIIDFFFKVLSIDIKKYNFLNFNFHSNPSLSVESTLALRKFNEEFTISSEHFKHLVSYLYSLDKERISRRKYFLTLKERLDIIQFYVESNKKLFRNFFGSENPYILSEEELQHYTEHDEFVIEHEREIEHDIKERFELIKNYFEKNFGSIEKHRGRYITVGGPKGYNGVFGVVDKLCSDYIAGWVFNDNISKPSEVEVLVDNYLLTSQKSQFVRQDIKEIYGVDYNSGFHINWKDIKYPKEFLEYLLNKQLDEKLNIIVREKDSGYVLEGNYQDLYVKDILSKISQNNLIIVKKIQAINGILLKGYIMQRDKVIRAFVFENAKVFKYKNGQDKVELFIYIENKNLHKFRARIDYEQDISEEIIVDIRNLNVE